MKEVTEQAYKTSKRLTQVGWIVFLVFIALALFGYGSLNFAKAVGVTWLAYYFVRFSQGNEDVADHRVAIPLLAALMTIFAWGQLYSGWEVDQLLKGFE